MYTQIYIHIALDILHTGMGLTQEKITRESYSGEKILYKKQTEKWSWWRKTGIQVKTGRIPCLITHTNRFY